MSSTHKKNVPSKIFMLFLNPVPFYCRYIYLPLVVPTLAYLVDSRVEHSINHRVLWPQSGWWPLDPAGGKGMS